MNYINITMEAVCLVICLIILLTIHIKKVPKNKSDSIYKAMLYSNMAVLVCDSFTYLFEGRINGYFLNLANCLMYFFAYCLITFYILYTLTIIHSKYSIRQFIRNPGFFVFIICTFLIIINFFTGIYFTYLPDGYHHSGEFYYLSHIYLVGCAIVCMFYILFNIRKINKSDAFF